MKHYVLLYAEGYADKKSAAESVLRGFSENLDKLIPTTETTKRLGPHSMLFERGSDIGILGRAIAAAEAAHLKYTVLFLSSD